MQTQEIMQSTFHAIKAVELRNRCGRYVAQAYARKHGVSSLYRLACQLEAAKNI